jgi:hypothetical protein
VSAAGTLRQSEDLCKVREEGLSVAPGGASEVAP